MTIITNRFTVAVVLLVMLGVLVYLGYGEATSKTSSPVDHSLAVVQGGKEIDLEVKEVTKEQGSLENRQDTGNREFFVEYRLQRDRTRSRQIELLKGIIENPNSVTEDRHEAQQMLLRITNQMEQELQLENLIVAKGYKDAALFIQPDSVTVIINAETLTDEDVTKIADLVARTTGQSLENITIIPKM